jgi:predicted enzyme related to lactoylglutathione lyase
MAMTPKMVTIDCADPQRLAEFWTEAGGYGVEGDYGSFVVLRPADGAAGVTIGLQKVPERRVGKNRVHIDWYSDDRPAEVERLVKLGATVLGEETVPGLTWTVLADPEGNEFCVAG